MKTYATFDIGGTSIKHGIIDDSLHFYESAETPTEAKKGGAHIVKTVLNLIREYQKDYFLSGICLSTAGIVNPQTGEIVHAASQCIPDYVGVNWKKAINDAFGLSCEVENDVNCAGLCESYVGAGRGHSLCACLTVGTGIGGCIISEGKIFRGAAFGAGEVGYMHLSGGSFQALGATTALVSSYSKKAGLSLENCDGKTVFSRAESGDSVAVALIDEMCDVLGKGIANLCFCINPEAVILGGGIMAQRKLLEPKIRSAMDRYLIPYVAQRTKLLFAEEKNRAGMIGAYIHFKLQNEEKFIL